jgi:hypothetical protein
VPAESKVQHATMFLINQALVITSITETLLFPRDCWNGKSRVSRQHSAKGSSGFRALSQLPGRRMKLDRSPKRKSSIHRLRVGGQASPCRR